MENQNLQTNNHPDAFLGDIQLWLNIMRCAEVWFLRLHSEVLEIIAGLRVACFGEIISNNVHPTSSQNTTVE